jgi:prevent-host-death family protein
VNIDVKSIHSLTEFKRNASELVGRAKASRRPLVLTVNGRAEAVVLGADVYQEMVISAREARRPNRRAQRSPAGPGN